MACASLICGRMFTFGRDTPSDRAWHPVATIGIAATLFAFACADDGAAPSFSRCLEEGVVVHFLLLVGGNNRQLPLLDDDDRGRFSLRRPVGSEGGESLQSGNASNVVSQLIVSQRIGRTRRMACGRAVPLDLITDERRVSFDRAKPNVSCYLGHLPTFLPTFSSGLSTKTNLHPTC